MLKNLSRDPPSQSIGIKETEIIPDPWETPPLDTRDANSFSIDRYLPIETDSLGSGSVVTKLPQLPSHKEQSSHILLRHWLGLKTRDAKELAIELINALTLLSWLEIIA